VKEHHHRGPIFTTALMTTPSLFSFLPWKISSASKAAVRKSIIFGVELETIHGAMEVKLAGTISIFFLTRLFHAAYRVRQLE
jgi:hypothetical protein